MTNANQVLAVAQTFCQAMSLNGHVCPHESDCAEHVEARECEPAKEAEKFLGGMAIRLSVGERVARGGRVGTVEGVYEVSNFGILPPSQRAKVRWDDGGAVEASSFQYERATARV